jgi:hypothetical protein
MSNVTVDLPPRSKSAFSFNMSSAGPISVEVQWGGGVTLSGFLFGPNRKVPYDKNTGASPLTLSTTATQAGGAQQSTWAVRVYNPHDTPVRATLSIKSPPNLALRSLAKHDQNIQQPGAVALFANLLARYVNNAPVESKADRALKEALDKLPDSRTVLGRAVNVWQSIPAARRQAIFGAEFCDLPVRASIPEETLALNLRKVADVGLVNFTPGLRVRKAAREIPSSVPLPAASVNVPPSRVHSLKPHTYRIDFAGFFCKKETNWDASDEDEPYIVFVSTDGFKTWSKRSDIYDDPEHEVDSGDTRGPRPPLLSLFGENGPEPGRDFAIVSTVMEHDEGDPDYYRKEIHYLVEGARAIALAYGIPVPDFVANLAVDAINWLLDTGDDRIGTQSIVFQADWFHGLALSPPLTFKDLSYTAVSPVHHGDEWWNGAEYYVMYNVRHDPPYVPTQQWSDWEFLGGEFQGAPAVSSWGTTASTCSSAARTHT